MGIIRVLPPEAARLIAAGEVIERPASVLRELLDNSIDAEAREVSVELESGGLDSLRVVDDGLGMDAEDLALSVLPHATSKIRGADDLLTARSLGFRGEALASIAAAARLEIRSRRREDEAARRLVAGPGLEPRIEALPGPVGTSVGVTRLFDNFPARKRFLKRAQAEAGLCRQVFQEKALAHPGLGFRYLSEGKTLAALRASTRAERVLALFAELPSDFVYELRFSGQGFSGEAVIAGPAFYRGDRRLMQVYVNRRRIQDYALMASLDYAFEGYLPGGAHPAALLFLEIDPSLADFNIHPAKKEVRLKEPDAPRRAFVEAARSFLGKLARRAPEAVAPPIETAELGFEEPPTSVPGLGEPGMGRSFGVAADGGWGRSFGAGSGAPRATSTGRAAPGAPRPSWEDFDALRERPLPPPRPAEASPGFAYFGTALGLFLVAEREGAVYLVDQHAAHERILFDELSARPPEVQELLVAERYEPEDAEEERRVAAILPELEAAGFRLEPEDSGYALLSCPVLLRGRPLEALRELIRGGAADLGREARAMAACKAAVKDGDYLEPEAAAALAESALRLPEPRCPHGRPIYVKLSREELFRLVRREI